MTAKIVSVVEFHAKLFPEGHFIPCINSWFEESLNSTKIRARGVPYRYGEMVSK